MEDLIQGGDVFASQSVGHELARQVPDGQAIVQRVELGVEDRRHGVQRIEVSDEMAADPVHVDERLDVHLLGEAKVPAGRLVQGVGVLLPAHR